jgi:hypothetical protein
MAYKEYADRMKLPFGFIVGTPSSIGFTVDIDELRRTIDLLRHAA